MRYLIDLGLVHAVEVQKIVPSDLCDSTFGLGKQVPPPVDQINSKVIKCKRFALPFAEKQFPLKKVWGLDPNFSAKAPKIFGKGGKMAKIPFWVVLGVFTSNFG